MDTLNYFKYILFILFYRLCTIVDYNLRSLSTIVAIISYDHHSATRLYIYIFLGTINVKLILLVYIGGAGYMMNSRLSVKRDEKNGYRLRNIEYAISMFANTYGALQQGGRGTRRGYVPP